MTRKTLLAQVGLGFLVAFLAGLPAGYAFLEWSVQPSFCTNCHLMDPYYKSWEESSHGKHGVACIECHYEPGVVETARGKVMALNMVVKYFTGAEGTKPWAEVSDASCMRSGCHSTRLLAGQTKFDAGGGKVSIPFDHTPHLLEMRGSKKLRCTSCHSQIVQGEHLTVTTTTCFLCHFKGAAQDPKLSACSTCHGAPEKTLELAGGQLFDHGPFVERGVGCESCHAGTTAGTGEVPRHRCSSCHGVVEHVEKYGETELIHRKHVTDHKVDCLECHTEITHRMRERPGEKPAGPAAMPHATASSPSTSGARREAAPGCAACHETPHGTAEAFYRGEGGRGAPGTPSAMWLARVDCSGCHREPPGTLPRAAAGRGVKEFACIACHGPASEGMLAGWQGTYGPAIEAVGKEVDAALAGGDGPAALAPETRRGLEDARHDVALLRADGSRGVHNPAYARALLESARARVAAARPAGAGAAAPSPLDPPFATRMTCATSCHAGIADRDIRKAGTRFEHRKHLGKGFDCDACHGTGLYGREGPAHGVVLPRAADCVSCHHGAKPPSTAASRACADCHADVDRFLRGTLEDGTEGPQMMRDVACDACHGDALERPALPAIKARCVECHEGDAKYASMTEDWIKDAADWRRAAETRLAKVRPRARAKGGAAAEALAKAEAVLARVLRAGPVHNILRFEEEKDAFADACAAAEKAAK